MYQNKHCAQNCRKNKYKTVKGYYGNSQVKLESLCESFSLFGSLVGGSRNLNVERSDQCYCHQKSNGEMLRSGGQCYPEKLCGDCDLNKSGLCSQSAEPSSVAGI